MRRASDSRRVLALAFLATLPWCGCGPEPGGESATPPPEPPPMSVFRARYFTPDGEFSAGVAFAAEIPGAGPVLATAHHVFGSAGGFPREVASSELPGYVRRAAFQDAFDPSAGLWAARALAIEGAAPFDENSPAGDVAAFLPREDDAASSATARLAPFALATRTAEPGERVWLAAPVIGLEGRRLHGAVATEISDEGLWIRFDEPEIDLTATSGAPVLNARGEVAGIAVGGTEEVDGVYGLVNPVDRFRDALAAAARARPPE